MSSPLYIFDFDDTLVFSGAAVHVTHANGAKESLESHEFATYIEQPGDEFDFSEFDTYPPEGQLIQKTFKAMQGAIASSGAGSVVVLSARGEPGPMKQFLADNGLSADIEIVGVQDSNPAAKAKFVDQKLSTGNFDEVIVYEDSMANINALRTLVADKYPAVIFQSHHVQAESLLRKTISRILRESFCVTKK
jgi:hypothetical protein